MKHLLIIILLLAAIACGRKSDSNRQNVDSIPIIPGDSYLEDGHTTKWWLEKFAGLEKVNMPIGGQIIVDTTRKDDSFLIGPPFRIYKGTPWPEGNRHKKVIAEEPGSIIQVSPREYEDFNGVRWMKVVFDSFYLYKDQENISFSREFGPTSEEERERFRRDVLGDSTSEFTGLGGYSEGHAVLHGRLHPMDTSRRPKIIIGCGPGNDPYMDSFPDSSMVDPEIMKHPPIGLVLKFGPKKYGMFNGKDWVCVDLNKWDLFNDATSIQSSFGNGIVMPPKSPLKRDTLFLKHEWTRADTAGKPGDGYFLTQVFDSSPLYDTLMVIAETYTMPRKYLRGYYRYFDESCNCYKDIPDSVWIPIDSTFVQTRKVLAWEVWTKRTHGLNLSINGDQDPGAPRFVKRLSYNKKDEITNVLQSWKIENLKN